MRHGSEENQDTVKKVDAITFLPFLIYVSHQLLFPISLIKSTLDKRTLKDDPSLGFLK